MRQSKEHREHRFTKSTIKWLVLQLLLTLVAIQSGSPGMQRRRPLLRGIENIKQRVIILNKTPIN